MMDMEMNADLGGDDGSESSQSSSEGSSASSTFCTLEKDYARIIQEMKANEALAPFEAEYTRIYESLYKSHRDERELSEQLFLLKEEVADKTQKIFDLKTTVENDAEEIEKLKQEITNAMKLVDAAHTREQNAQETIENLKLNIAKLNQELDHKTRQLAAEEDSTVSKQKEGLLKERERLMGEMETLRQRLKNMSLYTEDLEKKTTTADHQISEMQETLDARMNEISKEKRAREKAETDVQQLQEELKVKTDDLERVNASLKTAGSNLTKLESLLKEQKNTNEALQKDVNKLMLKRLNLQTDFDNANVQIDSLEKEIAERDKQLKTIKHELNRAKEENSKYKFEKDSTEKRFQKVDSERAKLEQELKRALQNVKNAEHQAQTLRKQHIEEKQRCEALIREKNMHARSKELLGEQIKRVNHELVVCEHSRKKIEHEFDNAMQISIETKKMLGITNKERDKCNQEAQELARQVEDYISEVKLKQVEIFDYKKRLAEAETKYRQQQNLFEALRAERNSCSKSLIEAQDQIQELKSKLEITGHQIEQLKEDVAAKDADLVKKEFLLGRVEKEKEILKVELQSSRKAITELKREIEEMKQEEKRLRQTIQQADVDINRHRKDIENAMNERDILGTQLVRRNDELSLQYNRINILNGTLQRGETQYNQRLEDIRLLKLEVKKLRTEKTLLSKHIANMSDMRQEIFHLNRDLTKERLKVMALEEEVQTPLNIHRWRKLEGTDPDSYELIKKVHILQKRLLKMASEMIEKEKKVKESERLYSNLRAAVSVQSTAPFTAQSRAAHRRQQHGEEERGKRIKCLISELNMYEVEVSGYKIDIERMGNEMNELRRKYIAQKKKLQKVKSGPAVEPMLPEVASAQPVRRGSGLHMVAAATGNCALDSSQ